MPLVFDEKKTIYTTYGVNFDSLSHLDSIGLIKFETSAGLGESELPQKFNTYYYEQCLRLERPQGFYYHLLIGRVLLTKVGQELFPICGSKPVEGFYEYVKEQWREYVPTDTKDE